MDNFSSTAILLLCTLLALWSPASRVMLRPQTLHVYTPAQILTRSRTSNPLIDQHSVAAAGCGTAYVVKAGDTLSGIAAACGVTTNSLARANNITLTDTIYPGQSLTIPKASGSFTPPAKSTPALSKATCTNPYTVRKGDTLAKITKLCGVSVANLKQWNSLQSDRIRVGQLLYTRAKNTLPFAPGAPAATPAPAAPTPPPQPPVATPTAEIEPPQVK